MKMVRQRFLLFFVVSIVLISSFECKKKRKKDNKIRDEEKGEKFLKESNKKLEKLSHELALDNWNYETNMTDQSREIQVIRVHSNLFYN